MVAVFPYLQNIIILAIVETTANTRKAVTVHGTHKSIINNPVVPCITFFTHFLSTNKTVVKSNLSIILNTVSAKKVMMKMIKDNSSLRGAGSSTGTTSCNV